MAKISGSLKLVTGNPATLSQAWLRAPHGRTQSGAYVTEAPDTVQVTGGAVSFDALPGPLVMTLVSHGTPMHTVKLLVPDKTSATLAECIEAAELATDGTRNALERLALEVQAELGQVPSLVSSALAQDSTIIDAVQQASALRVDTSVGTRVFTGNQMVYGDTGTRVVNDIAEGFDFSASTHHRMTLRRVGEQIFMEATGARTAEGTWITKVLPLGFRPRTGEYNALRGTTLSRGLITPLGNSSTLLRLSTSGNTFQIGDVVTLNATWFTDNSWPSSLPGTPV